MLRISEFLKFFISSVESLSRNTRVENDPGIFLYISPYDCGKLLKLVVHPSCIIRSSVILLLYWQ